jgi:hypothetical protein
MIRLAVKSGGLFAEVQIPLDTLPEVIVCDERIFSFHSELIETEDPCAAEYREVCAFRIPEYDYARDDFNFDARRERC